MGSLRILVADDHDLMRRGIKTIIESRKGWEICGEAITGSQAVAKAQELKPDIAILDISMPELNGIEAAKRIRKTSEKTEILVLSAHYSDQIVRDVIGAGIRGYLVKSDSGRDLSTALENLATHRSFYTSSVPEVALDKSRANPESAAGEKTRPRLTSRENEIIQLLAEGKTSKDIAVFLNISVKTVETHRANIMRKLELHTVTELVRYAIRNQIVEA
jgi:DNA-binding NarL/FixJ family response regulator